MTSPLRLRFLLPLTLCLHALAQANDLQLAKIDDLVNGHITSHHIPGLSIAIIDGGKVLRAKGYGFADVENQVVVTAESVFRIASISKPVTAVAAMKLVDAGKLNLDQPIQKYCPDFPKKPWPITTRQLLSHQSGIRNYRDEAEILNTRHYSSIKESLTQFNNDPLDFEPGTKMQYTSYGYIVLGCVMEKASGQKYEEYMRRAIFQPAGMAATRLDDVYAIIPGRAHGYRITAEGELKNAKFVDVSNKQPGSGINSTANDMGRFLAALYAGRLVSKETFDQMLNPAMTRDGKTTIYGLGFFRGGPIGKYRGMDEAGHGGDQQGFSSVLYLLPEKQFGVVILSNLEGEKNSQDFIELSRKIYDVISPPN